MANSKFKALVHFIIHECKGNPESLGAVRLNKTLWFIDTLTYQESGASVTGEKYVKRDMGPVPATVLATLNELEKEGTIKIERPEFPYSPTIYKSLKEPDGDQLSENERKSARDVLEVICKKTTSVISEFTHGENWDAAKTGEEIPMCATLVKGQGELTREEIKWAESVVQQIA